MIIILSGGLDSTVLAHLAIEECHDGSPVDLISFDYGQKHSKEIESAKRTAVRLHARHDVIDLTAVGKLLAAGGSSLLDNNVAVPSGHYEDESMKATVVPNRNLIMLSVAAGVAIARGHSVVAYGAHAGDHAIYPDCRDAFADAAAGVLRLCDWTPIELVRPFIGKTKADIVSMGRALGVPMHDTWSCYRGGAIHCGTCGTCVERREAFAVAGVVDDTPYAAAPDA